MSRWGGASTSQIGSLPKSIKLLGEQPGAHPGLRRHIINNERSISGRVRRKLKDCISTQRLNVTTSHQYSIYVCVSIDSCNQVCLLLLVFSYMKSLGGMLWYYWAHLLCAQHSHIFISLSRSLLNRSFRTTTRVQGILLLSACYVLRDQYCTNHLKRNNKAKSSFINQTC